MQKERAGKYENVLNGELQYKAFVLNLLPPQPPLEIDEEMLNLLGRANRAIGLLDGISGNIPDIDLFVAMYVRKEALLSSQIEGTQATLDDILDPDLDLNINQDVSDVINYIKAMWYAVNRLKELPLCNRLLREIHVELMEGVRGQERNPGEFRRSQNWIGPAGGSLKNAVFVPPTPQNMEQAISELEKYINTDDDLDLLIKIGLIHFQFETIHPFLDGNGRIGRMLITIWLMEQNLLKHPVLYLSYYFKRNRIEYYDRLMDVRLKGHFEQWIKFFLKGVIESAEDAADSIKKLSVLHDKNLALIKDAKKRNKTLIQLFNFIERNPIIDIGKTANEMGLQYNTVAGAVKLFEDLNILRQVNSQKRNRYFAYTEYLDILKKDTEI